MGWLFVDLFRLQVSMLEGWLALTKNVSQAYQHTAGVNHHLIHQGEAHRWHDEKSRGADWQDRYGKRCHDIDVEHML